MVVWGGNHRLLPLHSGADSSLEPLGRGFEEAAGRVVRPRRAARKARRGMAASLMRERRRGSKLIHVKIMLFSPDVHFICLLLIKTKSTIY